ncbi:NADP-dependent oxidoreductase [Thermomonospora umbrina]|uniref:NADPH2:quinone reductase n=1 Tax=Thermomonospora umbrina TaxID=111806 RepID=A0A3D9T436_9ACTN|nr:NADP-dependent oxidoreductase [Thermomonospora umbrina]REF00016.1 NADPH2:quinone reductase [Thermomonospora umbrina]
MKALATPSYIPLEELAVMEVADPVPGPGQLLLRVRAAALNPLDVKLITGEYAHLFAVRHPFVVGMDAAGTVAAVGEGVSGYAVGDEVVAYTHFDPGAIAEYTLVAEGPQVAHRPAGLDAVTGAALPSVALSAGCVLDAARLGPGDDLLVIGATGGVGSITVQLAAQARAEVIGTATAADAAYVLGLGARATIDHTATETVEEALRLRPGGFDVVVDLVHTGTGLVSTAAAVKPGGRLISTLFGPDDLGGDVTVVYVRMSPQAGRLRRFADQAATGRLTVEVVRTAPLADAPKAVADFAAGVHTRGKVVITL